MPAWTYFLWLIPCFVVIGLTGEFSNIKFFVFFRNLSFAWYLLSCAAVTSIVVGMLSVVGPTLKSYAVPFIMWLVAMLSVALWALKNYFQDGKEFWHSLTRGISLHRWEILAVGMITIVAFVIRVIHLATLPSPFAGDEASIAYEVIFNPDSIKNMFVSGIQGHPKMYFNALAISHHFFEPLFAQRLLSVILGTLTLPVVYVFLRKMWDKYIAFGAILYLVGYHFHHHYSRFGMYVIGDPLIVTLGLYFAYRVMAHGKKSDFIFLGLATGMAIYFYVGARILLPFVLFFLAFVSIMRRGFLKEHYAYSGLFLLALIVAAFPLGLFWAKYPNEFMTASSSNLIFKSSWWQQQEASGKPFLVIFANRIKDSFGIFGFSHRDGPGYNAPIPLVDKLSLVPFLIGFLYSLVNFWKPRNLILLMVFIGVVFAGATLTVGVSTSRLLSTSFPVAAWVSIGMFSLAKIFHLRKKLLVTFALGAIAILSIYNLWFYFHDYANGDYFTDWNTRFAYQISEHALSLPNNTVVFFYDSPNFYIAHPTSKLILSTHNYSYFDVLQDGRVSPPSTITNSPRIFVFFHNHRIAELSKLQSECPGGSLLSFNDRKGEKTFVSYELLNNSNCLPSSI